MIEHAQETRAGPGANHDVLVDRDYEMAQVGWCKQHGDLGAAQVEKRSTYSCIQFAAGCSHVTICLWNTVKAMVKARTMVPIM